MVVNRVNKKTFFVAVFGLVVAGSVFFALASQQAEAPNNPGANNTPAQNQQQVGGAQTAPGTYVDYSNAALAQASGDTILFFHASWCPQCRAIEDDIETEGVPGGVTILKVDYDSHQDLRQKYGVTIQTSFVRVDKSGNKQGDVYVAYNEPTLAAIKRDFLAQ